MRAERKVCGNSTLAVNLVIIPTLGKTTHTRVVICAGIYFPCSVHTTSAMYYHDYHCRHSQPGVVVRLGADAVLLGEDVLWKRDDRGLEARQDLRTARLQTGSRQQAHVTNELAIIDA